MHFTPRAGVLSFFGVIAVLSSPITARAGMPSVLPMDVETVFRLGHGPAQRLQVISFFLMALLLSALVVKWLWNGLQAEFTRLPRLSYSKALMMTIAWGLLFCIVLVMISGARELMTPGAWEKKSDGLTFQLAPSDEEVRP